MWKRRLRPVIWIGEFEAGAPRKVAGSLRRHDRRYAGFYAATFGHARRRGLLFGGYFLDALASAGSAMVGGVRFQRGMIVDDHPIGRALPDDNNIHAADYASIVVEKVNIRSPKTHGNKHSALVASQDQVDNFGIGDGNFSKWTIAMNCCREPLCKHNRLFGRLIDRELTTEAF